MSEELQPLADQINLGAHQHPIDAADESGQVRSFVVHRPTMGDQIQINVAAAFSVTVPTTGTDAGATVGRPLPVPEHVEALAEAVATLNQVIDLRPAGIPADVRTWTDEVLLGNLWTAYLAWRNSFRLPVPAAGGSDSSTPDAAAAGLAV